MPNPAPPDETAQPRIWGTISEAYAAYVVPFLGKYVGDAMGQLAARGGVGGLAVDVACGPGTAAMQLAASFDRVDAVDFSPQMIARLHEAVAAAGLDNIDAQVGDGQRLPFATERYDAGVSMFGLMFFPDRPRGFAELHRVLKPGKPAAVAAWTPPKDSALVQAVMEALVPVFPELSEGFRPAPGLEDRDVFAREMTAAGFVAVEIDVVTHELEGPDPDAMWQGMERSFVPIVRLKEKVGEAVYAERRPAVLERWHKLVGGGPCSFRAPAYLGLGTRGAG